MSMSSFVNSNQSSATRYDFIEHVRHVYRESGYGVSIKRSDGGRRVLLAWNLGRDYMKRSAGNAEGKTRKTGTRLQGCHWEAFGKKSRDGSWKVKMRKSQHNHEPSDNMAGHPGCRRMLGEEKVCVQELVSAGLPALRA